MTKKNENLASTNNMFDNVDLEPTYLFEHCEKSLESVSNNISLKVEIIENYDPVIFINEETEKLTTIAESIAANFCCIAKLNLKEKTNYKESFFEKEKELIKSFFLVDYACVLIENAQFLEKEALNIMIDVAVESETKLVMTASSSIAFLDSRLKKLYFDGEEDIEAYKMLVTHFFDGKNEKESSKRELNIN